MTVNIQELRGVMVIELAGELTLQSSSEMYDTINGYIYPGDCVVFDMRDVTHITGAGIRNLLLLYRSLVKDGNRVCLAGLSQNLQEILSIIGFLRFFDTCNSLESSIRLVRVQTGYKAAS